MDDLTNKQKPQQLFFQENLSTEQDLTSDVQKNRMTLQQETEVNTDKQAVKKDLLISKEYLTQDVNLPKEIPQKDSEEKRIALQNRKTMSGKLDVYARYSEMAEARTKWETSREHSRILSLDKHFLKSDSKEMKTIKTRLKTLNGLLYVPADLSDLSSVYRAYEDVLNALDHYIDVKNPRFPEGKRRLRLVRELRDTLAGEQEMLKEKVDAYFHAKKKQSDTKVCPADFLQGIYLRPTLGMEDQTCVMKDVMMFAKYADEKGNIDPELLAIQKAHGSMIAALNTDVRRANSDKDEEHAQFKKERDAAVSAVNKLLDACDAYLQSKQDKDLSDEEIKKWKEINAFRNKMVAVEDDCFGIFNGISKGNNAGQTYLDGLEILERGYEQAQKLAEKIHDRLEDVHHNKKDIEPLMMVYIHVDDLRDQKKNGVGYYSLKDVGLKKMVEDLNDTDFYNIGKMRMDATRELKDVYDEIVRNPVPKEFLEKETDDPNDKELKKQYALLMINMHPAYYRLKAVDSFVNLFLMDEAVIEGMREGRDRYYASKDMDYRNKREEGDKIGARAAEKSVGKGLKKEAVDRVKGIIARRNVLNAKKNMISYVDSDFVAFDAEEEKKAEADFKAEWKRHEDYIAKCEKK